MHKSLRLYLVFSTCKLVQVLLGLLPISSHVHCMPLTILSMGIYVTIIITDMGIAHILKFGGEESEGMFEEVVLCLL